MVVAVVARPAVGVVEHGRAVLGARGPRSRSRCRARPRSRGARGAPSPSTRGRRTRRSARGRTRRTRAARARTSGGRSSRARTRELPLRRAAHERARRAAGELVTHHVDRADEEVRSRAPRAAGARSRWSAPCTPASSRSAPSATTRPSCTRCAAACRGRTGRATCRRRAAGRSARPRTRAHSSTMYGKRSCVQRSPLRAVERPAHRAVGRAVVPRRRRADAAARVRLCHRERRNTIATNMSASTRSAAAGPPVLMPTACRQPAGGEPESTSSEAPRRARARATRHERAPDPTRAARRRRARRRRARMRARAPARSSTPRSTTPRPRERVRLKCAGRACRSPKFGNLPARACRCQCPRCA